MHKILTFSVLLVALIQLSTAYWFDYQPSDAFVQLGETARFSVGVSKSTLYGYKYKWFVNDIQIAYSTDNTLRIVATEDLQNARVYVSLYSSKSDRDFLERSNTAFLHIKKPDPVPPPPPPPLPTLQEFDLPSSVYAYSGEYIDLTIPQQPENVPSQIQWTIDGAPLVGQIYPQLRMKVTSELDNVQIAVVVVGPTNTIRRTTILHVYLAKWILIVAAVGAGFVFLGIVGGIIGGLLLLKKRGYIFKQATSKSDVPFKSLATHDGPQDPDVDTSIELDVD